MKLKYTWITFILELIIIVVFRLYQFITIGDVSVRVQWDNIELVSAFTSSIAVLIIIIMTYLSKDAPKFFILHEDKFTGTVGCLTGVMVFCGSVNNLLSYMSNGELMYLFLGIFGLAAGLVFIIMGICNIKGKDYFENYRLLTLVPTLWSVMSLLNIFFKYNSIPTTATHVISVLDEIFLVFFLFYQARIFAGLFNEATFKKLFYCGFSAVLFMTLNSLGQLLTIMNLGTTISLMDFIDIVTEVIIALYILCFIFSIKLEKEVEYLPGNEPIESISEPENDSIDEVQNVKDDDINDEAQNVNNDDSDDIEEINKLIETLSNESKNDNSQKLQDDKDDEGNDIEKLNKFIKSLSNEAKNDNARKLQDLEGDSIEKINKLIVSLSNKQKDNGSRKLQDDKSVEDDDIEEINKLIEYIQNEKQSNEDSKETQEDN